MQNIEQHPDLKKTLKSWDSVAIIISIVVGVGIFRVPAEVARYLNTPHLILGAWFFGGIISLLGALCFVELSASFPQTGGAYVYLRESYGPCMGFLFAWTEILIIRAGSIAAVSFVCAQYLLSFLSLSAGLLKPIAIGVVIFLSFTNIVGLHYGKRTQDIVTALKIFAFSWIIIFGLLSKNGSIAHFSFTPSGLHAGLLQAFGLALIPILWTYGGWHENTFVAGETRNATRIVPFSLIVGIVAVTFLYLITNLIYIYIFPVQQIAKSELIASDLLQILFGKYGRKSLEAIIIISSLGCINAMIIVGSRILYAMAKDNGIFRYMQKVNSRFATPVHAIIINTILSIAFIIIGNFNKLLFFTGISVWLFFALVTGGIFLLRHKFPNIARPYKVWGYPVTPVIFLLACVALCINTIISFPFQALMGLCIVTSGIPVYIISQRAFKKPLQSM